MSMKKYLFSAIILFIPFQGYSERFFVCDRKELNECIQELEKKGYIVKNIRYERINEYVADAIITFE